MRYRIQYQVKTTGDIFLGDNYYHSHTLAVEAFIELKKLFTAYRGCEYDHVPTTYFPVAVVEDPSDADVTSVPAAATVKVNDFVAGVYLHGKVAVGIHSTNSQPVDRRPIQRRSRKITVRDLL